jgi:hypothetical protein
MNGFLAGIDETFFYEIKHYSVLHSACCSDRRQSELLCAIGVSKFKSSAVNLINVSIVPSFAGSSHEARQNTTDSGNYLWGRTDKLLACGNISLLIHGLIVIVIGQAKGSDCIGILLLHRFRYMAYWIIYFMVRPTALRYFQSFQFDSGSFKNQFWHLCRFFTCAGGMDRSLNTVRSVKIGLGIA